MRTGIFCFNIFDHMTTSEFKKEAYSMVDFMVEYMEQLESYPVKSQVRPKEIINQLPPSMPLSIDDSSCLLDLQTQLRSCVHKPGKNSCVSVWYVAALTMNYFKQGMMLSINSIIKSLSNKNELFPLFSWCRELVWRRTRISLSESTTSQPPPTEKDTSTTW